MDEPLPKLEVKEVAPLAPLPDVGATRRIKRPEIVAMETRLRVDRFTAEAMFKRAKFEDKDFDENGTVVITEVLRPCRAKEPAVCIHVATGMQLCVDHYECDGVVL